MDRMPGLTLVFTTERTDFERVQDELLDAAEFAVTALETMVPGISILKAFVCEAGDDWPGPTFVRERFESRQREARALIAGPARW